MSLTPTTLSPIEAYEELMRFAGRFGEAPLRLAFHAAVPQSFRLDLLHLIKRNFVPEAKNESTAEADLLLSPLCKDIGRGYFQFDSNVRYLLLDNLAESYASEPSPRIKRVANFLLWYANHFNRLTSGSNDRLWRDYLETQRWVALAFIDPESAAIQFAECLQQTVTENDVVTRLQLGGLAASLSAPLAGYSHLLNYASALQSLETEGRDETIQKFGDFLDREIKIGSVILRPASAIISERYEPLPPEEEEPEIVSLPPDLPFPEDAFDVYISYAHIDNTPLPDDKGWMDSLHDALYQYTTGLLGRALRMWRDQTLMSGSYSISDGFDSIRKAKVFVAIVSPAYLNSEWTERELNLFLEKTGGGLIYNRSRVFKVIKTPVELERMPEILRETLGYKFFEFDERENIPRQFNPASGDEGEKKFFLAASDLARDIAETLRILDDEAKTLKKETVSPDSFFDVPFASKGDEFVGREDLFGKIWEALNRSGRAAIGQAISVKGFGGLGKTQLAVEYAHRYRDKYKNGVFWLTADESIDSQILQIADKQGWINSPDKMLNQLEEAKSRFRALSECLVIFDNVLSYDHIKNYMPEPSLRTHILVTSREKIWEFYEVNLDLLERNLSRELLLKVSGRTLQNEPEQEYVDKILEQLGDIPLAIEMVGSYLKHRTSISFQDYWKLLQEVSLEHLERQFPESSFTQHDKSVIRSLKISEKFLSEEPLVREILDILSWSAKSTMGYSLLQTLAGTEDSFALKTALGDSHSASLIRQEANVERYSIHPLLARIRREENPLQYRKDWAETIVRRLREWFYNKLGNIDLSELEAEIEHLSEWQKLILDINPVEAINLVLVKARFDTEQNNYQKAEISLNEALNLYQNYRIEDESLLAYIYYELSNRAEIV